MALARTGLQTTRRSRSGQDRVHALPDAGAERARCRRDPQRARSAMRAALRGLVILAITVVATWTATSLAGARKVIVLTLDGDADPALRTRLQQSVVKAARANGDGVTIGNTTFAETAAAAGCDPATPACAD